MAVFSSFFFIIIIIIIVLAIIISTIIIAASLQKVRFSFIDIFSLCNLGLKQAINVRVLEVAKNRNTYFILRKHIPLLQFF